MKKYLKYSMFVMIAGAIALGSCKKKDDTPEDPVVPGPMFDFGFVKAGNISKMDLRLIIPAYGIDSTFRDSVSLKTDADLGGGKHRMIFNIGLPPMFGGAQVDSFTWQKESGGLYEFDSCGTKFLLLAADPTAGSTYIGGFGRTSGTCTIVDTMWRKVLSVSESVTVPAGTFSCVKFKEWNSKNNPDSTYILFYLNASKGFVQQQQYDNNGQLGAEVKLRSTNF